MLQRKKERRRRTADHEEVRVAGRWPEDEEAGNDVLREKPRERGAEGLVAREEGGVRQDAFAPEFLDYCEHVSCLCAQIMRLAYLVLA